MDFQSALSHGLLFAYATVFVGGLLTALTPCVYPLIPITVALFGAKEARRRIDAALLSATYVLGMALLYTLLGVGAAWTGKIFGSVMGNPWVIGAVALIFAAFAASMFGAFEIALPSSLQGRLTQVGGKGFAGALGMGFVAGLIAAPCTGPVLGSVLFHVATTQRLAFGGTLLFAYALGMGLPFFIIGTFVVSLPKSGAWMEAVKSLFGIAMLIVALYLLKDALPVLRAHIPASRPFGWGALGAVGLGVALGAVHLSFHGSRAQRLRKGAGLLLTVAGGFAVTVWLTAGAVQGYTPAQWLEREQAVLTAAKAAGKPVVLDFGADWCAACKELERQTYPSPLVEPELRRFVFVKIDQTKSSDAADVLAEKYGIAGLPYVVFFDSRGELLKSRNFFGFKPPEQFATLLKGIP